MAKEPININDIIARRKRQGDSLKDDRIYLRIPNARVVLMEALVDELGEKAQWLPEYEEVADWLSDNQGKGLMCIGNCGRGKTVITQRLLPGIIHKYYGLVLNCYTALALNDYDVDERGKTILQYKAIARNKLVCIDDVGTEPEARIFGESHLFFSELVDEAERKQKLLICSTNLDRKELLSNYDARTVDRLTALTRRVRFKGESLRH